MAPRKKQASVPKSTKANFFKESPKKEPSDNDESVDELLDSVHEFIEGVYRDLSLTPTQRPSLNFNRTRNSINTLASSLETLDDSYISTTAGGGLSPPSAEATFDISVSSPEGAAGCSAGLSPLSNIINVSSVNSSLSSIRSPLRRNMDAEIERINRMCDNVDESLRSNGIFMNTPRGGKNKETSNEHSSPTVETSSAVSTLPVSALPAPALPVSPLPVPVTTVNVEESHPVLIDLCESQTQTPECLRQPIYYNNVDDNDDDVVIVSSNIVPVIDLCTPGHMEPPIRRSTIEHAQLNRRRLGEFQEDVVPVKVPTTVNSKSNAASPPSTAGGGPTPFMCAVCMESCLHRQPTSTKCGHVFCNACIRQAARLTRKCPLCNTKLSNANQLFRIYL